MKLTAITIRGIYEVECDACARVVDVTSTYAKAIQGRRDHHQAVHANDPAPESERIPALRGICPGCNQERALLASGLLRSHDVRRVRPPSPYARSLRDRKYRERCPGSNQRPVTPTEEATP